MPNANGAGTTPQPTSVAAPPRLVSCSPCRCSGMGPGPQRSAPRGPSGASSSGRRWDRAPASGEHDTTPPLPDAPRRATRAQELRTLHEFLRLATTARTWNELLETVVDGTRDAMHAGVSRRSTSSTATGSNLTARGARTGSIATRSGAPSCRSARGSPAAWRPCAQAWSSWTLADDARFLGPGHRPAPVPPTRAVRAAHVARPGRRRAQRPDRDRHRNFTDGRRRAAVRDRGPPRGDRREGPAPGPRRRRRSSSSRRARPGPVRAHRARHPRAPDAARGRSRVHGPAGRGTAARRSRRRATPSGVRPAPRGTPARSTRSNGWTGWSTRSSRPCA